MTKQPVGYLSYLLRLWQTGSGDRAVWRASLQNPMTGERLGFASLKALYAFLSTQVEEMESQVADDHAQDGRSI